MKVKLGFFEPDRVDLCADCPDKEEPVDAVDQAIGHEPMKWIAKSRVDKYDGDWTAEQIEAGLAGKPYEVIEGEGNLLVNAGVANLLNALIGTAITAFSNANARIGVGDSSTAAANTQTDLQASTNKLRKGMDATFPSLSGAAPWIMTFKSTFITSEANFAWNEWGIFNAASGATSMLNRKVESMGTKSSGQTWVHTATFTLS
jgi:hypothetical protein